MKKTLTLFMKGLSLSAIVLSVCLAMSTTVKAASLNIDDTSPNGTITVSWDFSDGPGSQPFWLNDDLNTGFYWRDPVGSTTLSERGGALSLYFAGNWGETLPVPPSGPPRVNVYFTEANNPTLVSDILSYSYAYATINGHTYQSIIGSFQSFLVDVPLGQYTLLPPDILLSEAAGPFLWPQTGGSEPLGGGISFSVTPVPEPTTMIGGALLLLPLGAVMLQSLRKRQRV